MRALTEGDGPEALRVLDELERDVGLQDTGRFLRIQVLLVLSRPRAGASVARLLRRAAQDALRIELTDPDGILRQTRQTLAQALCEHAVRTVQPSASDGLAPPRMVRKIRRTSLPLVLLARKVATDEPSVEACETLLRRMLRRYEELERLPAAGSGHELALSE